MIPYLESLTIDQLDRLFRRVFARMTRGDGYQPFGYDWPTVRASYPVWYGYLRAIEKVFHEKRFIQGS